MARFNGLIKNTLLTEGVEKYTDLKVSSLERHDDPQVAGSIALRVTLEGGAVVNFLISAQAPALNTAEEVADHLEEAEYTTWPPTSGKISFF